MGFAMGGAAGLPLPPHKAQKFTLKYQPGAGYSVLSGQGQQMPMVASFGKNVQPVANYLEAEKTKGLFSKGAGCNWSSLPIMIGSKSYELKASKPGSNQYKFGMFVPIPNNMVFLCVRQDGSVGIGGGGFALAPNCSTPPRKLDGKGDMTMTLIVKFQSRTSASGMLLFEGNSHGNPFFAKAPVSMTR